MFKSGDHGDDDEGAIFSTESHLLGTLTSGSVCSKVENENGRIIIIRRLRREKKIMTIMMMTVHLS